MMRHDARTQAAWLWAKRNLPREWIIRPHHVVGILDAADEVLVGVEAELAAALRSIEDQELLHVEISDLRDRVETLTRELVAKDALVAELQHWIGASM